MTRRTKKRLLSRKFWLAIAGFISMLYVAFGFSETEATKITSLIMAGGSIISYIFGEGLTDCYNKRNRGDRRND